ncbi:hypothetical protein B1757_02740 [Acidithiobacillus marinus]|uniref:Uncharacterized protein n=1 Tax=Acidithiobacillus marinus TaxID=187490 RepID=A0A2I1DPA1_9PROT|nr:hypothetical protein [Acidithiobacillus marinus]PKY11724.1 hypothetical protein B1757_02740 [Acidithiobacillus marinus]
MSDQEQKPSHHLDLHTKPRESGKRLTLILVTAFVVFTIVFFIIGKFMGGHSAEHSHPVASAPAPSVSQTVHNGAASS